MGVDIHIKLYKYNKETNLYEKLALYKTRAKESYRYNEKGEIVETFPVGSYEEIYIDVGRDREMFDGLCNLDEDNYGIFPSTYVAYNSFEEKAVKELKEEEESFGCYDFSEVSLADIGVYLSQYPTVIDYESLDWDSWDELKEEEKPRKTNRIKYFYEEICKYAHFADWEFEYSPLSRYKIVFYFDC